MIMVYLKKKDKYYIFERIWGGKQEFINFIHFLENHRRFHCKEKKPYTYECTSPENEHFLITLSTGSGEPESEYLSYLSP